MGKQVTSDIRGVEPPEIPEPIKGAGRREADELERAGADRPPPRVQALDPLLRRMMRAEAMHIAEICQPHADRGADVIPLDEVITPVSDATALTSPDWLSKTAPELVDDWVAILADVRAANEEWAGVGVLEYWSYCANTGDNLYLKERVIAWLDAYVHLRADVRHLCPRYRTPLALFRKVVEEVDRLVGPVARRHATLNVMLFNTARAYANWLTYMLLLAPLARRWGEEGVRESLLPRPDEKLLRAAAETGLRNGWLRDPLGDLTRAVAETDPGLAERFAGVTDDEIRARLAGIAADLRHVRPYLIHNFHPEKTVVEAAGLYAAWMWTSGEGFGRLIVDEDRGELLRGVYGPTCRRAFSVTHEGLLAVSAHPWITAAEHPGAAGVRPLAINLALMEQIHARLLSFYDRVEQARFLRPRTDRVGDTEAADADADETVALAAVCRTLAAGDTREAEPAPARRIPALRLKRFAGLLVRAFGCEVRNGKGSEVVVTRPGAGRAVLGRHKADPEYHPHAVRRVLGQLGIDPRVFISLARR